MQNDLPQLHFVATHGPRSREASAIRRAHDRGELHRVYPGAYVDAAAWQTASSRARHVLLIHAMTPRLDDGVVLSHRSAAALHAWPSLEEWPAFVEVTDPTRRASQTRSHVSRRAFDPPGVDIELVDGRRVTTPIRTALDLSASLSFKSALVVLDHGLHANVFSESDLDAGFCRHPLQRGRPSVKRALAFADGRAESPLESIARVSLYELGAPRPELQYRFDDAEGFIARCDFFFRDQGVVLEADGLAKYRDPRFLKGSTASDVVIRERRREQRLRAHPDVRDVIRCEWRDVMSAQRFRALLLRGGIPLR